MKYLPSIGIETHVQLKTNTKLFSAVGNDAREAEPNSLISHIDVGMPGALPVLNKAAIELSVRAGLALNGDVQEFSKFDRKHYFYPDLPKGYQISQYEEPIILGGYVDIDVNGQPKRIGLVRVHLEEDAGKNTHPAGADYSLVDLNRAGTPLLEIVSRPDINSPEEAKAYARELYLIMKYAGVSDVDMYHGNLRFDINVSLSPEPGKLGTRAEVKNLNSFRAVEAAAAYEIKRQAEMLDKGQKVIQETRGWDEAKQKTLAQRGKEEAHDYRYMPEPDIPPIELDPDYINEINSKMPKMPGQIRSDLAKSGLNEKQVETILDSSELAEIYISAINLAESPEVARIWSQGVTNNLKIREAMLTLDKDNREAVLRDSLAAANATVAREINSNQFIDGLEQIVIDGKSFESLDMSQINDSSQIELIVDEVLAKNEKAANDVKAGQEKAIGFLVGQVMAKSQGQADPTAAARMIKDKLK